MNICDFEKEKVVCFCFMLKQCCVCLVIGGGNWQVTAKRMQGQTLTAYLQEHTTQP
jgi:hypothetical protein